MKTFLMMMLTVALTNLSDNYIKPEESAVVYYSPSTTIQVDFVFTEETCEKGIYADYAEPLLGITDAIQENQKTYTLTDVNIYTSTDVDLNRVHKVAANKDFPIQLLSINERGLLTGYNLPPVTKEHRSKAPKQETVSKIEPARPLQLPEEVVDAKTPSEKAHAIARYIFHLREVRTYLLSGEVEHAPADGEAMRLVLEELDNQERQLIELFIGTKTIVTKHETIQCRPMGDDFKRWDRDLYFSKENGFTTEENIDAEKIEIRTEFQHQFRQPEEAQKKKSNKKNPDVSEPSQLVYNLPGNARVLVQYRSQQLKSKVVPVAQFGMDVPLSKDLFTGATLPSIVFNEKTGNIISISK